jgi:uncharacterized protein YjbI with pentapeptide repeats
MALMLIEDHEFDRNTGLPEGLENAIFNICSFDGLEINGGGFGGAMMHCVLAGVGWYCSMFNCAILGHNSLQNCTFRGVTFAGSAFVQCKFQDCRFILDNVGGGCTFDDCSFTECIFERCEFVLDALNGRPVFVGTRWYGCKQTDCAGLVGQF